VAISVVGTFAFGSVLAALTVGPVLTEVSAQSWRVGVLGPAESRFDEVADGLKTGLRDHGYIEGFTQGLKALGARTRVSSSSTLSSMTVGVTPLPVILTALSSMWAGTLTVIFLILPPMPTV